MAELNHPGTIRRTLWQRRPWFLRAYAVAAWLFEHAEGGPPNNWAGSPTVRGDWGGGGAYSARFLNDAGEIGIWQKFDDDNGRWALMIPANAFRVLALWYVWRWAWGEWFGLRRRLFYRWNHRRVVRMMRQLAVTHPQSSAKD